MEAGILQSKSTNDGVYKDWDGEWNAYVKSKVDAGILPPSCLAGLEDGGGKPSAKAINKTVVASSPLNTKKPRCHHCFFKEETDKNTAKRDSGYILDGIICEGHPNSFGKEFVMCEQEATCKEKALVPTLKNPAWWCMTCNWVLCSMCHGRYCSDKAKSKAGRRVCRM